MPTVEWVADHTLLLALPAFAPAVVVVGVVVWVAMKDRRTADDDEDGDGSADGQPHGDGSASANEDGSP
ncbi:hypothetical protein [Mycolicibacterium sp.]|uniref:hypothetical protein n=1 Tax=Mycolicibacterium sp. TaxID=2320850 RepID=UPI001A33A965|nr:hypothetical protein [Mycolicibacterium sp.]MBJ7339810.1 hypothetical protein [Mycolicibacterium sp.]